MTCQNGSKPPLHSLASLPKEINNASDVLKCFHLFLQNIIQCIQYKDHLRTIYELLLRSCKQPAKQPYFTQKNSNSAVFFNIFETVTEIITKKHSLSIYIEQSTTLVFKPRSNFANSIFRIAYQVTYMLCLLAAATLFSKQIIFPNPSNQN
jgi:hypothetical protein